jgi:hypothetical protein
LVGKGDICELIAGGNNLLKLQKTEGEKWLEIIQRLAIGILLKFFLWQDFCAGSWKYHIEIQDILDGTSELSEPSTEFQRTESQ